jgi:SAM-dependent methyltransferase
MTDHRPDDPYADIAELYDLEHDGFADDVPFYLQSVTAVGDPVLELGCGTGRLLRPLAQAGFRATGVDRSAAMLARAEASLRPAAAKRRVTLHLGEMTGAADAPGGPFGVAILGLNGLLHLPDPDEQIAALTAIRTAMDPRGQVIIDVLNPTPAYLGGLEHGVGHEGSWETGDGCVVDKFTARTVDASAQIIRTRLWYDITGPDGQVRRVRTSFDLRFIYRHELELMLQIAGYASWQVYGDYELGPHTDSADRLIIAAELS